MVANKLVVGLSQSASFAKGGTSKICFKAITNSGRLALSGAKVDILHDTGK